MLNVTPTEELEVLNNPNPKQPREMAIMDRSGHLKNIWDADVPDEVEMARTIFEKMTKKGYLAFSVDKNGNQGQKMKDFDPKAEKMILTPQLRGG